MQGKFTYRNEPLTVIVTLFVLIGVPIAGVLSKSAIGDLAAFSIGLILFLGGLTAIVSLQYHSGSFDADELGITFRTHHKTRRFLYADIRSVHAETHKSCGSKEYWDRTEITTVLTIETTDDKKHVFSGYETIYMNELLHEPSKLQAVLDDLPLMRAGAYINAHLRGTE